MTGRYDSTADTLSHSRRVGELMGEPIVELVQRSTQHDLSKTQDPERAGFDEHTQRLSGLTYGSPEYAASLADLRPTLEHHYAHNRHHPEHFADGIDGMTLVDLIEMLADWKASTERVADGRLSRSLEINAERFGISPQLAEILRNTAERYGWMQPDQI